MLWAVMGLHVGGRKKKGQDCEASKTEEMASRATRHQNTGSQKKGGDWHHLCIQADQRVKLISVINSTQAAHAHAYIVHPSNFPDERIIIPCCCVLVSPKQVKRCSRAQDALSVFSGTRT